MIAGHLQIKNDYYYMVLSYLDANGKRKQPWFPTGLPIKNNKKRAEKMLLELRQTYVPPAEHKSNGELSADMLFADFIQFFVVLTGIAYVSHAGAVHHRRLSDFRKDLFF